MGLNIPEDLSIVGFDDAPIASAIWPALTTVRQPYLDMARRCLQILDTASDPVGPQDVQMRHILPHELIVRESTAPKGHPGE
jgi:LacI family transcriptional regulator